MLVIGCSYRYSTGYFEANEVSDMETVPAVGSSKVVEQLTKPMHFDNKSDAITTGVILKHDRMNACDICGSLVDCRWQDTL